ncbi:ABC transporter ATP-binding protein [Singulisphaera sp. PoT]|uniref:ABC transporter ATP-binding protein n=1 Tax=Singulisphaera sp. PoT TaxID=3411797 RepID=UPI003BF5ACD0
MKNFARLVRFAWPYRLRFGLSLCCALLVALLYAGDIATVLPLLKILFYNENCKKWVAVEIASQDLIIRKCDARLGEVDFVDKVGNPRDERLKSRFVDVHEAAEEKHRFAESIAQKVDIPLLNGADKAKVKDQFDLPLARRDEAIAQARCDELKILFEDIEHKQLPVTIEARRASLAAEKSKATWWHKRYLWIQPTVNKYLPDHGFQTLVLLLGVVMVGVTLKGIFLFLQEVLVADVMQLTLFDLRNHFYRRTMALDLSSFGEQGSAELISRFTNDMDSVGQGLNTLFSKVIREPLRIISCLSIAIYLNWRLTFLALVLVPVSAMTAKRAGQIMKRAVRRSLESMSTIYKILQESFQGIVVVKAYTMERRERRRFFLETKSLYKKSVKVATIDALSDPVLEFLALTTVFIALLSGSYLVLNDTIFLSLGRFKLQLASQRMAIEDLLALYAVLAGISDPVRKLANVHSRIQRAAAAADRICALMDRQPQVADRAGVKRLPRHSHTVEFDQVVFGYNGRDPVLRGINLTVRHGEMIALVGPNGCGKSTLMNLIPRFWEVQSGSIRIDGHDLRDIQLRSLREQIGIVIQETVLFEDTIANNIAYGQRGASREAIIAVAKRSYAHQFIMSLPNGYDTVIGERGLGLSGGQRQRIALARAMLRDPAILILDEATSAVDIQDEALIRKAIEEFARNRTTFLITHSLGSLQFADRIVLMNAGRIEAVGTDSELRRNSPLYRRLHEIHFHRESA